MYIFLLRLGRTEDDEDGNALPMIPESNGQAKKLDIPQAIQDI